MVERSDLSERLARTYREGRSSDGMLILQVRPPSPTWTEFHFDYQWDRRDKPPDEFGPRHVPYTLSEYDEETLEWELRCMAQQAMPAYRTVMKEVVEEFAEVLSPLERDRFDVMPDCPGATGRGVSHEGLIQVVTRGVRTWEFEIAEGKIPTSQWDFAFEVETGMRDAMLDYERDRKERCGSSPSRPEPGCGPAS